MRALEYKEIKFGELRIYPEKPERIETHHIINMLEARYNPLDRRGEWAGFAEVSDGTGGKKTGGIDFWAINCWSGNTRFAYEIKVSRADFLKEMKSPAKRRKALLISNHYFFIAPKGMLKTEEIPPECGLKEVEWVSNESEVNDAIRRNKDRDERGWVGHVTVPELGLYLKSTLKLDSPYRDSIPPSWNFVASLFRRMTEMERTRQEKLLEIENAKNQEQTNFSPELRSESALEYPNGQDNARNLGLQS